jgi:hypothetical protein
MEPLRLQKSVLQTQWNISSSAVAVMVAPVLPEVAEAAVVLMLLTQRQALFRLPLTRL